MSPWTYAWLAWGVFFGVVEYKAIKRKDRKRRPDTLSEHVWWVRDHVPFARWALGGFLAWLVFHFMFDS